MNRFSIIIVNYKSSRDILQCLESLAKYENNFKDYEIIIVDNNSGDNGLDEVISLYPSIKMIYASENGGFAYGNNIGISQATGEYIFLLNPDTYITDDSVSKLYNRLKNDNTIGIIGPKLLFPDGKNQSYYLPKSYLDIWKLFCERFYLNKVFRNYRIFNSYLKTYMDYDSECLVEQVSGAALLFKKDILDKTGLLDEKYFMYFEETDFCLQAHRAGIKQLYYPAGIIYHKGGFTSESSWEKSSVYFMNSFKHYFRKNFNPVYYSGAIMLFVIGSLLRIILFMMKGDKRFKYHFYQLKAVLNLYDK